jgi:CBS domain-containing protein
LPIRAGLDPLSSPPGRTNVGVLTIRNLTEEAAMSSAAVVAPVRLQALALGGLGSAAGGTAVLTLDNAGRGADGLISTPSEQFFKQRYALESGTADIRWIDGGRASGDWLGQVQVRAQSGSSDVPVFVGIGSESDVARYLSGVRADRVTQVDPIHFVVRYQQLGTVEPTTAPVSHTFWVASATVSVRRH